LYIPALRRGRKGARKWKRERKRESRGKGREKEWWKGKVRGRGK